MQPSWSNGCTWVTMTLMQAIHSSTRAQCNLIMFSSSPEWQNESSGGKQSGSNVAAYKCTSIHISERSRRDPLSMKLTYRFPTTREMISVPTHLSLLIVEFFLNFLSGWIRCHENITVVELKSHSPNPKIHWQAWQAELVSKMFGHRRFDLGENRDIENWGIYAKRRQPPTDVRATTTALGKCGTTRSNLDKVRRS